MESMERDVVLDAVTRLESMWKDAIDRAEVTYKTYEEAMNLLLVIRQAVSTTHKTYEEAMNLLRVIRQAVGAS